MKTEAMLIAARSAFAKFGYRAVTMPQIAEEAHVSTRTLYNHYTDKLTLFAACLEFGSTAFPVLNQDADPKAALRDFGVALVKMLWEDSNQRMGMLVYREGAEFPELVRAADQNQQHYLIDPLAAFLTHYRLADADGEARAKILLSMMLSGWHRRVSFHLPAPADDALEAYAALVVHLFVASAAA